MSFDLQALLDEHGLTVDTTGIGTLLAQELAPVLGAAAEDLREFGVAIAHDHFFAFAAGDEAWKKQLRAQTKGLLEVQRIRVEVVDWDLTEKIVGIVFKAAVAAIGGVAKLPF
jgi:hypothetical protein